MVAVSWIPLQTAFVWATLSFAIAGCFNPPAQTDATGDPADTTSPTSEPDTTSPTTSAETSTSEPPTSEPPCTCTPPTYCLPDGGCGDCLELAAQGGECPAITPVCHSLLRECVGCEIDEQCDSRCDAQTHTCVECLLDDDCPLADFICDPDTHACVGCTEHADCPTTACDLEQSQCFPEAATHLYVDDDDCGIDPMCPEASRCCTLADALTPALLNLKPHTIVHVSPGQYSAAVAISVDARRIAILAETGSTQTASATPPLSLTGTSALFVARLAVVGTDNALTAGVDCVDSPSLWFDDGEVVGMFASGLHAQNCDMHVRRTRISRNATSVLAGPGSRISLENSTVSGDHSGLAVNTVGTGQVDLRYSTVLDYYPIDGQNHLISCDAMGALEIRNSVVVDLAGMNLLVPCPYSLVTSAVTDGLFPPAADRVPINAGLVLSLFEAAMADDLDLAPGPNPLSTAARWQEGDPRTDIHGDPRPAVPDAVDAAGADR